MRVDVTRRIRKVAGRAAWAALVLVAACGAPVAPSTAGGAAGTAGAPPAAGGGSTAAAPAAATRPPLQSMKIGIPQPSLSYLPAHVAWKRGYFEEEGIAIEF